MDDRRFDNLTRTLAHGPTRRQLIKALAGGAFGGLLTAAGNGVAGAAPACRNEGHPCEGNQTCCSGLICTNSGPGAALRCTACPAGTKSCGDTCAACCVDSDCPGAACSAGSCVDGQCQLTPIAGCCTSDSQCDDGNACTTDTCDLTTNTCVHTSVTCTAQDSCHVAGICDPSTGQCTNPAAADGSSCQSGNLCSTGDTCQAGSCVVGPIKPCALGEICNVIACNPATGQCEATPDPDGTPCQTPEGVIGACEGGQCTPGTTCTRGTDCPQSSNPCLTVSCSGGLCTTSNAADGTTCTANGQTGSCQAGQCAVTCNGATPVACTDASGLVHCCPAGDTCFGNTGQCCPPNAVICRDKLGNALACCNSADFCPPAAPGICCPPGGIVCPNNDGVITTCCAPNHSCINGACV